MTHWLVSHELQGPVKDFTVVHCPKCGAALDVPVQVARVIVFPGWVTVHFARGRLEHKCTKDSEKRSGS